MRKLVSMALALALVFTMAVILPITQSAAAEGEVITWYVYHAEPSNNAAVMEAANKIIQDKLGVTLDMKWTDPGAYTDKLNLMVSAGDEFDLAFVCNWVNPKYNNLVGKGALVPLDQYMNGEYMPDIMKAVPPLVWEGVRVNGAAYGIPNLQVMYDENGIAFNKAIADECGVADQVLALSNPDASLADLTAIFDAVYAERPDLIMTIDPLTTIGRDRFEYADLGIAEYRYDVANKKVIFAADDKYSKSDWATHREWYDKGYLPSDASTTTTMADTYRATQKVFCFYNRQKPGGLAELQKNWKYDFYNVSTSGRVMSTGGICSTLTGVSVTSKHPDLAVKFYNLLYADPTLYNLLIFGIEGQDYDVVDETHVAPKEGGYSGYAWMMGNQFNAKLTPGQLDGVWEETAEGNNSAGVDALCGMVVNREPIETELAAISAIYTEYTTILNYGLTDDIEGTYNELKSKVEAAGLQKVLDELQAQVDAFLAAK